MQLELFTSSLSKKCYCTDNFKLEGLVIRNANHALQKKYIQHNQKNSKLWLAFDIDRATCISEITDDLNMPIPTIFVQDKQSKRAHALYALETAIHHNENSSRKAIRYAAAVDTSICKKLDSDANFAGLIVKNPKNTHWQTYSQGPIYDLNELSEYVDLSEKTDKRAKLENNGLGRNCNLFDSVRRYAYQNLVKYDKSKWTDLIYKKTVENNQQFVSQLQHNEVMSIAKSITRFMLNNYTHRSKTSVNRNRDILINRELDLQDKQVLSAVITNRMRSASTQEKIIRAVTSLHANKLKVTQKSVSERSGLSLRAVKTHWKIVK